MVNDVDEGSSNRLVVTSLPRMSALHGGVALLQDPLSQTADDIKRLAKILATRWFGDAKRQNALSIISPERFEGRTTLACNLACAFAMGGARTLLVDGDIEHPRLHRLFNLEDVPSAAELSSVAGSVLYTLADVPDLTILPNGGFSAEESTPLLSLPFADIIAANADRFDAIFIDTPAASRSNDFIVAGQACKGALVVSRAGSSRTRSTIKMLDACDDAKITIVGGTMLFE